MPRNSRRMGGTCINCGRGFIREVRLEAGHSWSCPHCHTWQAGPRELAKIARIANRRRCVRAIRKRAGHAETTRRDTLARRAQALREAKSP